jgi:hypothetical protein
MKHTLFALNVYHALFQHIRFTIKIYIDDLSVHLTDIDRPGNNAFLFESFVDGLIISKKKIQVKLT